MNCIRYDSAEAITTDGINWDIYVSNDALLEDLDIIGHAQTNDVRYGNWSSGKGLRRGPIIPSDDFEQMEHMGHVVYKHLLRMHQQIPFPFMDSYELWLLDKNRLPLALLNSAVYSEELSTRQVMDWRAGLLCRQCFSSDSMQHLHDVVRDGESAGDYLTRYINERASKANSAQWFRRTTDGGGIGMGGINLDNTLLERVLDQSDFPRYTLSDHNHDLQHRQLIEDFHDWQAPWLLLLNNLDEEDRAALEIKAKRQALIVDAQFRLYPDIVDETAIKTARVEAMLRKNESVVMSPEEVMSTFYIELHPCPYE